MGDDAGSADAGPDAGDTDGDAGDPTVELESIAVTPADPSLAAGLTQQLMATGTYADDSTQDLTDQVAWASDDETVATVSNDAADAGLVQTHAPGTAILSATLDGVVGETTVTVSAAVLDHIELSLVDFSLAHGTTTQLTATSVLTDGTMEDVTAQVTWSSDDEAVAFISNDDGSEGLLSAESTGSAVITATLNGVDVQTTVTVTDAELVSITLDPPDLTVAAGTFASVVATGTYTDGTTQDVTTQVDWSSSAQDVATVSNLDGEQGTVEALAVGDAVIAGAVDGISGVTTVTVTGATLQSIRVEPEAPTIVTGTTQQLTATGRFSDGSVQDLTSHVTWSSDDEAVGTVSNTGLASGVSPGSAQMTASFGGMSDSVTLTVSSATLENIEIEPINPSIAAGTSLQLVATGSFSDGSSQDLTTQVVWASDAEAVATVSNAAGSHGVASGVSVGSAQISASFDAVTATTMLTVTDATLEQLEVTPASPSIAAGTKQQFKATGTFSDSSKQDLTTQVTWASDDAEVATISNATGTRGLATGHAEGSVVISATLYGVEGTGSLTVTSAVLQSLTVTPQDASVAVGTRLQYTATGSFSDGTEQDMTGEVAWASDDEAVATISNGELNAGLADAVATGSANISAVLDGVTGSTPLTVTDATLESIVVSPADATIAEGTQRQYTATGIFSDGSEQDLTDTAEWGAQPGEVASVSNIPGSRGLATGKNEGTATVSATLDGIEGTTSLTVTTATLVSIIVEPVDPTIAAETEVQFTATGVYGDGSEQDLTTEVTWSSDDTAVATISNGFASEGEATGVSAGEATITASYEGVDGTTLLTVTDATLTSIVVTPTTETIEAGTTLQYTATGVFSDSSEQDLTAQVTWDTDDALVAYVRNTDGAEGEAAGVSSGTTEVSATLDGVVGTATLSVTGGFGP